MKLSRIDRIQRTWAVDALFPQLAPGSVTSVSFALLPQRSESPATGTVWTAPISVVSGNVTVLLAGPEADSTGALVVTATADLWAMATNSPETEAVKIPDRITVAGSSAALPALPSLYVASVNGKTGSAVLTFSDVGAASTTDSRLSDARAATDASVAALVNNGASSTTGALRAAFDARYGRADPVLSNFSYDATTGNLLSYQEDGITITMTYNTDGTVATSQRGTDAAQTYTYSGGNLVGVA